MADNDNGERGPLIGKDDRGNAQVVALGAVTRLDIPPERVLENAIARDLEGVVLIGFDKQGEVYAASSFADGGTIMWLLEVLKKRLLSGIE